MCTCVWLCVGERVLRRGCTCVWRAEDNLECHSSGIVRIALGVLAGWEPDIGWPARQYRGSTCLCLPVLESQTHGTVAFICGFWRLNVGLPHLQGKRFMSFKSWLCLQLGHNALWAPNQVSGPHSTTALPTALKFDLNTSLRSLFLNFSYN